MLIGHFRETKVITVDEISQEHVFPERLRLKLANAKGYKSPIDIGSIAYATRGEARSRSLTMPVLYRLSSHLLWKVGVS
jgi:hypothetical protein